MGWLSKLLGRKEKTEAALKPEAAEGTPEETSEEETLEEEKLEKDSEAKRQKQPKKASPPSDVAKSTYIPVPENDINLIASHYGMLRSGGVAAALYIEEMPTKPFVVYGFITCVCDDLLPISLNVVPGLHTEHTITCPKCNTRISGSKGAMENFIIVSAGIDEVNPQYRFSKISILLDKLTNI
jgi:hypothetical protein